MTAESKKVPFRYVLSMWWLLFWRSLVGYYLVSFSVSLLYISADMEPSARNSVWRGDLGRILFAGLLALIAFGGGQLLVQQMVRKRYRRFIVSAIDSNTGDARLNNRLVLKERMKVVWALLWRVAPILGVVWLLIKWGISLPLYSPIRFLILNIMIGVLVFVSPLCAQFALRKRYSTFEMSVTERVSTVTS